MEARMTKRNKAFWTALIIISISFTFIIYKASQIEPLQNPSSTLICGCEYNYEPGIKKAQRGIYGCFRILEINTTSNTKEFVIETKDPTCIPH